MAASSQGRGKKNPGKIKPSLPVHSPRRVEFWVVVGGFLAILLLGHLDLLLPAGRDVGAAYNPEVSFLNEHPNPFSENRLLSGLSNVPPGFRLLVHLVGSVLAGFFLLRLVGSWPAALAGGLGYGAHPLHVALLTGGQAPAPGFAQPIFFAACLLFFHRAGLLGGVVLAVAVVLDPAGLVLPVFLGLLLWIAPGMALPRISMVWALLGVGMGLVLAVGFGVRAWPGLPPGELLPPGPAIETPVQMGMMTLGRALRHLYSLASSAVDYGRGEVALAWTWEDAGAVWILGGFVAAGLLLAMAVGLGRSPGRGSLVGGLATVAVCSLLFPVPGLVACLFTEGGLHTGMLFTASFFPGLLLALLVKALLMNGSAPVAVRNLSAGAVSLLIVLPLSYKTLRECSQMRTEAGAMRATLKASAGSHRLRRRHTEWLLRRDHNKLDIKNRLEALVKEVPEDGRSWMALGRFNWVVRRFPDAVKAFERALALEPGNPAARFALAGATLMARNPERTLEILSGLDPEIPEVRAVSLLAHARAGRPLENTGGREAPGIVLRARGMVLTESGQYSRALQVLERARAARPGDALVAAYRGWCLLELGRVDEAEDVLIFEALVDESGFLAHRLLGELYFKKGPRHNRRDAYHHFGYFVKHDRGHPDTPRILKILQDIQKGFQ